MRLLTYLRQKVGNAVAQVGDWLRGSTPRVELEREHARARVGGIAGKAWFLPFLDNQTGETPAMRSAYRRMVADPTIKAAVCTKLFSVASLDHQVHAFDDRPKNKAGADFIDHLIRSTRNQVRGLAEAVLLPGGIDGYSISEKVWEVEEKNQRWRGKIRLKALKSKDPETLTLAGDEYKNVTAVVGRVYNSGLEFDPSLFVIWSHLPLFENPMGMSDLRAAYRAYWLIDTAWKLRAIHLEKYTSPLLIGTYTDAGEQKRQLEAALERAKASTWLSVPVGAMLEAKELSQRGTADFQAAISDLREEVALGITGATLQMLASQVPNARGDTRVHETTSDLRAWYLASCLQGVINTQIVPDAIDLNFAGVDYPHVTLGGVDEAELKAALEIDQGLYNMRVPLSLKEVYDRYRRSAPRDDADRLVMPEQPPALSFTEPAKNADDRGASARPFCEPGHVTGWGYRLRG